MVLRVFVFSCFRVRSRSYGRGFPPRPAIARFSLPAPTTISCAMSRTRRFIPTAEWEDQRQLLGLRGERIAIAFLTSCGWSIEAHRFKLGRHDLDLVIRKGSTVAFVEVKTRRSNVCGSALEAVSRRKQQEIARVASVWILRQGRPGDEYRFDLVAIQVAPGREPVVEHVMDAWRLVGGV
jgi:putative endonuclease